MDADGNIYRVSDEELSSNDPEIQADLDRLQNHLEERAAADEARRIKFLENNRRYETLVHDSSTGPYRKDSKVGIEGIETISGDQGETVRVPAGEFRQNDSGEWVNVAQGDPGDEQPNDISKIEDPPESPEFDPNETQEDFDRKEAEKVDPLTSDEVAHLDARTKDLDD